MQGKSTRKSEKKKVPNLKLNYLNNIIKTLNHCISPRGQSQFVVSNMHHHGQNARVTKMVVCN